jgi:hypothetical protein
MNMTIDPMYAQDVRRPEEEFTVMYRPRPIVSDKPYWLVLPRSRSRQWVAEITGPDPIYGLARSFVTPNITLEGAEYLVRPGRTYDVLEGSGDRYKVYVSLSAPNRLIWVTDEDVAYPRGLDGNNIQGRNYTRC